MLWDSNFYQLPWVWYLQLTLPLLLFLHCAPFIIPHYDTALGRVNMTPIWRRLFRGWWRRQELWWNYRGVINYYQSGIRETYNTNIYIKEHSLTWYVDQVLCITHPCYKKLVGLVSANFPMLNRGPGWNITILTDLCVTGLLAVLFPFTSPVLFLL